MWGWLPKYILKIEQRPRSENECDELIGQITFGFEPVAPGGNGPETQVLELLSADTYTWEDPQATNRVRYTGRHGGTRQSAMTSGHREAVDDPIAYFPEDQRHHGRSDRTPRPTSGCAVGLSGSAPRATARTRFRTSIAGSVWHGCTHCVETSRSMP